MINVNVKPLCISDREKKQKKRKCVISQMNFRKCYEYCYDIACAKFYKKNK